MWGLAPWIGIALMSALAFGLYERGEAALARAAQEEARAVVAEALAKENAEAAAKLKGAGELAGQLTRKFEELSRRDDQKLTKLIQEVRSVKDANDRLPDSWRIALRQLLQPAPEPAAVADPGAAQAGGPVRAGATAGTPRP